MNALFGGARVELDQTLATDDVVPAASEPPPRFSKGRYPEDGSGDRARPRGNVSQLHREADLYTPLALIKLVQDDGESSAAD